MFIFAFSSTAFATTTVLSVPEAKYILEQIPLVQTEDQTYTKEITAIQIQQIQQMLNRQRGDLLATCKELLQSFGFSEREISTIKDEDVVSFFMDNSAVTMEEQYIKMLPDGTSYTVNKEVCLLEAAAVEEVYIASLPNPPTRSGGGDNTEILNSYMKIRTVSTYNNSSEKGWYQFYGWFTWLSTPLQRHTDAMSLLATGFAWSQNASDYYSVLNYNERVFTTSGGITNQNRTITKTTEDRALRQEGLYYEWDLPQDHATITTSTAHSDFLLSITGKARVSSYTSPYAFNLFSQYVHINRHLQIKPTFTWELGSRPGVSLDIDMKEAADYYSSSNYTNYTP